MYDLIIIGAGPAGMSAAVYAARAELDFIVIEAGAMAGGQVLTTYDVDNYLGFSQIGGIQLCNSFVQHAANLGVRFVEESVVLLQAEGEIKKVITNKNTYEAKTVIIATGTKHKKGNVPGEEEFAGKGVSYCATCDGAFFKNKVTAVVGGGDVALEDAIYLSRFCSKVYIIHRRDEFRAAKRIVTKAEKIDIIQFVFDSVVDKIEGDVKVTGINVINNKTEKSVRMEVDGVFFAVGTAPVNSFVDKKIKMDEAGYIIASDDCATNIAGIYAAGDVRTKTFRQIITAAADGAYAVNMVEKYLQ